MKKITLFLCGLTLSVASYGQQTITHSLEQTVVAPNTVACPTEPTFFQRTFDLANQFNINEDFEITDIQFGVEISESTGAAQVRLAIIDNIDPAADADADGVPDFSVVETLFEGEVPVTAADEGTVVSFTLPSSIIVPTGSILLYEIGETADGIVFRIGSNTGGETAPSYLFSTACGFGALDDFGFDNDFVMNLIGDAAVLSVGDNELSESITVFPNPTAGDLNINFSKNFDTTNINIININGQTVISTTADGIGNRTIDTNSLATGVYFAQLSNDVGTTTIKFIKN